MKYKLRSKQYWVLGSFAILCFAVSLILIERLSAIDEKAVTISDKEKAVLNHFRQDLADFGSNPASASEAKVGGDGAEADISQTVVEFQRMIDLGQIDNGKSLLKDLLRREPTHPQALGEWALLHLISFKNHHEAMESFHQLLDAAVDRDTLLHSIMQAYQKLDLATEGIEFLETLESSQARSLWLAKFYLEQNQMELALQTLKDSEGSKVDQLELLGEAKSLLARIYVTQGEVEQAIREFAEAEKYYDRQIKLRMTEGKDVESLVENIESLRIHMAKHLVKAQVFREAEAILIKLAERLPSDPEVNSLLDQVRLNKVQVNAG